MLNSNFTLSSLLNNSLIYLGGRPRSNHSELEFGSPDKLLAISSDKALTMVPSVSVGFMQKVLGNGFM
jgi:hypothetical protein